MIARTLHSLTLVAAIAVGDTPCEKDVAFALDQLGTKCASLLEQKEIDWKKVRTEMTAAAAAAKDDSDHLFVLAQLLARLRDGHAEVRPLEKGKGIEWPERFRGETSGPGLFLCRIADKLFIKNAFAGAAAAGIRPGMELLTVDGKPARDWLAARTAELADYRCFSTDQQAFFFACHWGLAFPTGTRLGLGLKDSKGKKLARTVQCDGASQVPDGPAFLPDCPKGVAKSHDLQFGITAKGYGYVHVRRCPADLPEQMDAALAGLGPLAKLPGLILDFRGNSGGSFDHDALFGRFVPVGTTFGVGKSYASAGPKPYGGNVVVLVDATIRSAGETAAGIFKEDGRAWCLGESATAGMSSQKEDLELPSGLFSLHFSVGSNKGRFNGGKGIEGIGVVPNELIAFAPKDLEQGIDTLIARAEALLAKFPQDKVPFRPAR